MADLPQSPYFKGKPNLGTEPGSPPDTPRWVKLFGIGALMLVVLFALLHLTGRGLGPEAHMLARQHELHQP